MFTFLPSFVRRHARFLSAVPVVLLGFGVAQAQTAPQLLPYTSKLIAGGGTAPIAAGGTCPVSGNISTDAFGDGCLATEIQLVGPRDAIADSAGNVFFSDYTNALVRRVDVLTGIVTAVAGGGGSLASGATCGSFVSSDARGDGCMSTAVKLSAPGGLAFSPAGDLYFGDTGLAEVRKIAATAGLVPAGGGIISLVAGSVATTYGYAANNASGNIIAATQSYLDNPYGLAFDANGNLLISDSYKNAVLAVNTTGATTTETGVSVPAGTIAKLLGETSAGSSTCPNSPASTNGCNYGYATFGVQANNSEVDSPYAVAVDPQGNVYFSGEYDNYAGKISPTGILTQFAGIQGSAAKKLVRAPAGSFGIGSTFGIAADANSNVYITDASSGVVWRVDAVGNSMYVVAGGGTACSTNVDAYGDGCPATKAVFGSSGTGNFAVAKSPGIFGVTVDKYSDLFLGDTVTNLVREVASGTQFGTVGNVQPTNTLDIHFAPQDLPAAGNPYVFTSGGANFQLGTAVCTTNSDMTTDCLLPVKAIPSAIGPFSGVLKVTSSLGGSASFPIAGISTNSPLTTTTVSAASAACGTGTTTTTTTLPLTFTARITSSGLPTGTVQFFGNGTALGAPQPVTNSTAVLNISLPISTPLLVTAVYSGDSYFQTSTSATPVSVLSYSVTSPYSGPTVGTTAGPTVPAGGTALYSLNVTQNYYPGSVALTVTGLPANSSYSLSPSTVPAIGCNGSAVVALSILTQQRGTAGSGFGQGRSAWSLLGLAVAFVMALVIGVRRRQVRGFGSLWMVLALLIGTSSLVACGSGGVQAAGTPAGSYTITVTATSSTGSTSSITVPLKVT